MPRYPMQPVPHGYFIAFVEVEGKMLYVAGQVVYGDDDGDGEVIDLLPFRANGYSGLERRLKTFDRRDEAVNACDVHRHNR